jgi:NADP-dependent aldehyde dehydrogenase
MKAMVLSEHCAAVGFTGSYRGGRYLHDLCAARPLPIPVYAEMGSNNPVLVLPSALETRWESIAAGLAGSVTLGVGQFCTNPGLILVCTDADATEHNRDNTERFVDALALALSRAPPGTMLTSQMLAGYELAREALHAVNGVEQVTPPRDSCNRQWNEAGGELFRTTASNFLANCAACSQEVFGPTSLLVTCASEAELLAVTESLQGQLTATVWGDTDSLTSDTGEALLWALQERAGRILYNGYPTGVEVCAAMVHGGPWPASTSPFHTSVGTQAITRFARPVVFQNFPDVALPQELQDNNPLGTWRVMDDLYKTKDAVPGHHPRG